MIPYYILFIVTFLFTVFDFIQSRYVRLCAYIPLCLLLVGFVGLRALGVDNDGFAYQDAFRLVGEKYSWLDLLLGNYDETMERGYLLFNKLVYTLGGNIHVVFMVMAFLTGLLNFTLIYKYSPMPFLSVLIYLCFFYLYRDFTQIRYALSAAMGFWSICFFVDKKYWWSFASVFFAAFIHSSVLIVPLFYLLYVFMRNYPFYLVLPVVGLIIGFFDPVMYLFALGGLPPTLAGYVEQEEFGESGYMLSAIAEIFILGIFYYRSKLTTFYGERTIDLFMVALSLGSFINLMFISFAIMQRLSSLLFTVIALVMPYLFCVIEDDIRDRNLGLLIRVVFMIFVLYYGLKMIDIDLVRPYAIV
ncbi:EpsG family protein [Parapedobacter sp. 10938]|uniref:EpsG family protein n=1 Tax=Parapedobacter flavus TaxID=3110225 RepID=UPI002DBD1705|nr:EpsG family protein [Parapedobacter sp. 10938]MEC3879546.1 EpsG family protein [Parapedobacter sp. 10938]